MSVEYETFVCPQCYSIGQQRSKNTRGNKKKGAAGPFCSRSCAGRYAMARRWKDLEKIESFLCPVCGAEGEQKASVIAANRKAGKAGPFCGRSCAGKYAAAVRFGRLDELREWAVNIPQEVLDKTTES